MGVESKAKSGQLLYLKAYTETKEFIWESPGGARDIWERNKARHLIANFATPSIRSEAWILFPSGLYPVHHITLTTVLLWGSGGAERQHGCFSSGAGCGEIKAAGFEILFEAVFQSINYAMIHCSEAWSEFLEAACFDSSHWDCTLARDCGNMKDHRGKHYPGI